MSRPIEFRAWHKGSGEYVYFNPEKMKGDRFIAEHFFDLLQGKHPDGVLEQYTGLDDADGVKIFEGDTLQFFYARRGIFNRTCTLDLTNETGTVGSKLLALNQIVPEDIWNKRM